MTRNEVERRLATVFREVPGANTPMLAGLLLELLTDPASPDVANANAAIVDPSGAGVNTISAGGKVISRERVAPAASPSLAIAGKPLFKGRKR